MTLQGCERNTKHQDVECTSSSSPASDLRTLGVDKYGRFTDIKIRAAQDPNALTITSYLGTSNMRQQTRIGDVRCRARRPASPWGAPPSTASWCGE